MTAAPAANPKNWYLYLFICFFLVVQLLWRLFAVAHEYPGRSAQILEMVLDGLMLLAVFGIRGQIMKALPDGDSRKGIAQALFIAAITAGVGLFLIRFTSDAAWWTGHLHYSLD